MTDADVRVDDDGDLCLEFGAGKMRVGFIVSENRERAGWYYAFKSTDGSHGGGSGKLTDEQVDAIRGWLAGRTAGGTDTSR